MGEPGVYSSTYAGVPRNDLSNMIKVLEKLKNINNRIACFKTIISLNLDSKNFIFWRTFGFNFQFYKGK